MDLKTREGGGRDEYCDFKRAPEELFNDSWFFANLLQRRNGNNRPKTVTSFHTEPCTPSSSNSSHQEFLTGKSYEETFASIKKLPVRDGDGYSRHVLAKAPSMPCSTDMISEDKILSTRGKSGLRRSKLSNKKRLSSNLVRAPSLPICLRDHEDFEEDEEIEFSMGRLITLASMNSSDSSLSPGTKAAGAAKGATPTSRIMSDTSGDVTPQYWIRQLEPQKCLNALNSEEVEGFNELGTEFDKCPDATHTSTTSHVRSRLYYNSNEDKNSAPLIPSIWGGKKSSNDTKEQIKFWARAVASNVRQQC